MDKSQKAIELLKKVRPFLNRHHSGPINAIYLSPAASLRQQADAIEYEESLLAEVDKFLKDN